MPEIDRTGAAVVAVACVACCLPLVIAAGPVAIGAGAVAATVGVGVGIAHKMRRTRPDRTEVVTEVDKETYPAR